MKKIVRMCAYVLTVAAVAAFAACGGDGEEIDSSNDNGNGNGSGNVEPEKPAEKVRFTTVSEAVYYGEKKGSGMGYFELTLTAEGHRLHLAFCSTFVSGPKPMPAAGAYELAQGFYLQSLSADDSYWYASTGGMEVTRKFKAARFTVTPTDGGCTIAGTAEGVDGTKIEFSYEGALQFADFNGEPAPGALTCLGCYGTYYGGYYIPSASEYYLVIYDTVHAKEGDPYNYRIVLDFHSKRPAGRLMPELGTYYPDAEMLFEEGTFVPGQMDGSNGTFWQVPSGSGSTRYMVTEGSFTIRTAGSGYQIFGTLKDRYGMELSFNYTGAVTFNNDAAGAVTSLTSDLAMGTAHYANMKCVYTSEQYNLWNLYVYDEASWTSKGEQGYFVSFNIPVASDQKRIPVGDYTAASHVLLPDFGNFIPGYIYAESSAQGSWLASGQRAWAPLRSGKVSIAAAAGDTYTVTFDVTDDGFVPNRITGTFTGAIPVTSDSQVKALSVRPTASRTK